MSLFKAKMHHIRFLVSVCLSADNRTNGRVRSSVQMEFDTNRRNTESNPTLNLNHNHTTEQYARSEHASKYIRLLLIQRHTYSSLLRRMTAQKIRKKRKSNKKLKQHSGVGNLCSPYP